MLRNRGVFVATMSALLACNAGAQCVPEWSTEFDPGDPDGSISQMAWFDDGAGMRLYAWGTFRTIGGVVTGGLARWDGESWEAIPVSSPSLRVNSFRVVPDTTGVDRLLLIGRFDDAGAQFVAQWDGAGFVWFPAGGGFEAQATGATDAAFFDADGPGPLPGQLIAVGEFSTGPNRYPALAWNGSQWALIPGENNSAASSLCVFDPDAEGPGSAYVVISTGAGYRKYTGPDAGGGIGTLVNMPQRNVRVSARSLTVFDADGPGGAPGRLIATNAGNFGSGAGVIAMFDGAAWTEIGRGVIGGTNIVNMGVWDPDDDGPRPALFTVLGSYQGFPNPPSFRMVTWDGTTISAVEDEFLSTWGFFGGAARPIVKGSTLPTAALGTGRGLASEGGPARSGFAVYDGDWYDQGRPAGGAPPTEPTLYVWDSDGPGPLPPNLIATNVTSFGLAYTGQYAARGPLVPGDRWGTGIPRDEEFQSIISSHIVVDPDGAGPAVPEFWATGTSDSNERITRRWQGSSWNVVPQNPAAEHVLRAVVAFDVDGDGPLAVQPVFAGRFRIGSAPEFNGVARFDGAAWQGVGAGLPDDVQDLVVVDFDGGGPQAPQMYACGSFDSAGPPVVRAFARWNGAAWIGAGNISNGAANDMVVFDPDGSGPLPPKVVVAGVITVGQTRRPIWFWNGSTLTAAPGFGIDDVAGRVEVLDEDGPDGPRAPAVFALMNSAPFIRRLTATGWEALEGGDLDRAGSRLTVFDADGDGPNPASLYVTGPFVRAGDVPSGFVARWGCIAGSPCTADWDRNGTVNSTDVSAFINDWFSDQAKGTLVTDWDHNGVVNSTDVSNFINAWFEQIAKGCG